MNKKVINKINSILKNTKLEEDSLFISHDKIPNGFSIESEYENIKVLLTDYIIKPLIKREPDFHAHRFITKGHKAILELKYLTSAGDLIVLIENDSALRSDSSFNDITVRIIKDHTILSVYEFSEKNNIVNNQYFIISAIINICKSYEVIYKFKKYELKPKVDK